MSLLFSAVYVINEAFSEPGGMVNTTQRPGSTQEGCYCHCEASNSKTTVTITPPNNAPEKYLVGQTYRFTVTVKSTASPTLPRAGFNLSAWTGTLGTVTGQGIRKQSYQITNQKVTELTHSTPKLMTQGEASWSFDYTPTAVGTDTLYATGNAVNGDGSDNNGACRDQWAWAPKFVIPVEAPSAVNELPTVKGFTLKVNPNPVRDLAILTLGAQQATSMDILVYDAAGRVISNQTAQVNGKASITIATKEFVNGSYMVEARSAGKVIGRTRLMVTH